MHLGFLGGGSGAIGSELLNKIWRAANTAPFANMVARSSLQQQN